VSFFITLLETSDASRRAIERAPKVQAMIHKGLTRAEYGAFLHDLYHIVWHFCPVMAAAVAIMAPAIVLTMIFQKYVVKGLTMGAVKG